ncbi:MAG TPA: TolC family protein [Opitutaceae bacterium]|nr:TolC family protein [Opitutaceae bacterium]
MSRFITRAVFLIFSLAATVAAPAQDSGSEPAPPPLSLEACVARALQKNFNVRIQSFTAAQAKDSLITAQATYDPTLSLSSQKSADQSAPADVPNRNPGKYSVQTTTELSVSQKIPTGGTLTASGSLERDYLNPTVSPLNPSYIGGASLSLTQPLLQGAGIDVNLASIRSARLGVHIANQNFKSSVLTVVFDIETAYFNLIFAREQYKVQQDTLKLAQQLYDENVVKRQTGVLTDLDVAQAQVGVATARNQLILDEQAVHNSEDTLLEDMGEREFKAALGPVDFPSNETPAVSFDYSYKLARDNGPNLAVIQSTIEQLKLDALVAKRNILPSLDFNGGLGYNSLEPSYADAAQRVWNGNGYSWQAGLTLSFPWGLRAGRAQYRQAMNNLHSEELQLDQADQQLLVQVRSATRAVNTNIESVRASTDETALSQKQYDLQKAKFDAGLATSYDVIQAQNQLESARVSELQAKVSLRTAVAQLHFLEGSSLQLYHINVEE